MGERWSDAPERGGGEKWQKIGDAKRAQEWCSALELLSSLFSFPLRNYLSFSRFGPLFYKPEHLKSTLEFTDCGG